jgi:hypothetical protein
MRARPFALMAPALGVLLLAAPAAAGERGLQVTGDETGGVHLTLRVNAHSGGALQPLAPGQKLRSGDRLEMHVEVDRAAWVYVLQVFPDGTSAVLFPAEGELKVAPGAPTRLPDPGKWFQLDEQTGTEHVVVVASARPLDHADRAAKRVIDEIRRPRRAAKKKAPAPAALSLKTRGLVVVGDDHALRAESDALGVALFRFSFEHTR